MNPPDPGPLEELETRLRIILPEQYENYDDVQPVSMGSAALKYDVNGKVAWDDIWESFCDLAMAGGPPHKGTLLEPGSSADIESQPERYREVVDEICRGTTMVTCLAAQPSASPGWVSVECESVTMAEWLVRAVVMENISAHQQDAVLDLPAGPGYRIEKEIKNVITTIAKTSHYWLEHMWLRQHRQIETLFSTMSAEFPLIQSELVGQGFQAGVHEALRQRMTDAIRQAIRLEPSKHRYVGWLGVECQNIHLAIWMMRALVVSNILSRREGTTLFVPINPESDPAGDRVGRVLAQVYELATDCGRFTSIIPSRINS